VISAPYAAAPGRTLPAAAYYEPEYYELECQRIFRREWLLVAHAQQLPEPGDYFAVDLAGEPVVVVRGADGQIRALSAVCRHRYMLVAEAGRGRTRQLTCPYHDWRYDLDGCLSSAPYMADVAGFDRAEHNLPRFAVEEWEGLVFVSLDPAARPLGPRLAPVREALTRYHVATARQVAFDDRMWKCNWKVAVENASECYHHLGTHKENLDAVLPARGTYGAAGGPGFAVHFTPVDGDMGWGFDATEAESGPWPSDLETMGVYTLFPNALILNAGHLVLWFSFLPEGVDRCRFLNGFLAPAALVDAGVVDAARIERMMNQINDQDEPIVEGVQRGVMSALATPGMLSHREPALADFYTYLTRALR
jgi:phenylpropionate dioxygenase-like ring-hydroxylating dioxygenase large terminal subunit